MYSWKFACGRRWICAGLVFALGWGLVSAAHGATVISQAPNTTIQFGMSRGELEYENPLTGNEVLAGYILVEWRDADYESGGYDDWARHGSGTIDGCCGEVWMRSSGQWIDTTTTVPSTVVSIHLNGDGNDGIAAVEVDGVEVARIDMGSSPTERVFILVNSLPNTTHNIIVRDMGAGAMGGDDIATFGAAVLKLKWSQPPVPGDPGNAYYGWNELSVYEGPQIVADDWFCVGPQPVTAIRWWGSFLDWRYANPPEMPIAFRFAIWTDVPDPSPGNPDTFSHPGMVIWESACSMFTADFVGWDFDPIKQTYEACYEFNCSLPQFFAQPPGENIYWLSIAAVYQPGQVVEHPWGWKTRPRDPGSPAPDDAVVIWDPTAPVLGSMYLAGANLWFPTPQDSWDVAFELLSGAADVKWSQPPAPYDPPDAIHGWDEYSVYGNLQIVADDWLCESSAPVSDIHWWGSFIDWGELGPPSEMPDAFHFAIWSDVPDPDPCDPVTFSHPGQVLWEYRCDTYRWDFFGWDFDPRDPLLPPETCFKFECDLPEDQWFHQDPGDNIYWLSIAAIYDTGVEPINPWGWKTRPRDPNSPAPDDAVVIWDPVIPIPGANYLQGGPLWWPTPQDSWDMCFELTVDSEGPPPPDPTIKWRQPPHSPNTGFDAESNLWYDQEANQPTVKWRQDPSVNWPGVHATQPIIWADDWQCEGGPVTDLHWFGNYELDFMGQELRGDGVRDFRLSIHADAGGIPGALLWAGGVSITAAGEVDTGLSNIEGCTIYEYSYILPDSFPQEIGQIYWFDVSALPANGANPPVWRWQEAERSMPSILSPPAADWLGNGQWTPQPGLNLAFWVTSEVNRVVADDFISDGRDIQGVRWWGSYFDPSYEPDVAAPPNVVDGWMISYHWADINANPNTPPDLLAGDGPPTLLAQYFAPVDAITIRPMGYTDCFGHNVYEYVADLASCCLLCAELDPRGGNYPPGLDGAFQERANRRYWMSIQAVIGTTWSCQPNATGNIPPSAGSFWGWHTGREPTAVPLSQASAGRIVDFGPQPPDCWNYGGWIHPPWLCPQAPVEPVNMSFYLYASDCPEDFSGNGIVDLTDLALLLSNFDSCVGDAGFDPKIDLDNSGCVDLTDLARLLSAFDSVCPTR